MSPTFKKIQPSLPVTSIPESIAYYTNVLGFSVVGRDRDDHTWLRLPTDENEEKHKAAVNIYLRSELLLPVYAMLVRADLISRANIPINSTRCAIWEGTHQHYRRRG